MQLTLESKLTDNFKPTFLQVINESHLHRGPAEAQSHFKVVIVSEQFEAKRQVSRHQLIYQCLADEMNAGVHALAVHTYTPQEWQQRSEAVPESTQCSGH